MRGAWFLRDGYKLRETTQWHSKPIIYTDTTAVWCVKNVTY